MKNRYDKQKARPRQKYTQYTMCLNMMILCTKQYLSNI